MEELEYFSLNEGKIEKNIATLDFDTNTIEDTYLYLKNNSYIDNKNFRWSIGRVDDMLYETNYPKIITESKLILEILKLRKKYNTYKIIPAFIKSTYNLCKFLGLNLNQYEACGKYNYCWASSNIDKVYYIDNDLNVFRCTYTVGRDKYKKFLFSKNNLYLDIRKNDDVNYLSYKECFDCKYGGLCSGGCKLSNSINFKKTCNYEKENINEFFKKIFNKKFLNILEDKNEYIERKFKFIKIMFFFSGIVFYSPVAMLIRTQRGISISEFLILQAILSFSILFFEIPLGYLTDKIGYKHSMILSSIFILLARFFLLFSNSFFLFIIESILEGIHFAFSSGTISSYVYVVFVEEFYAKKSSVLQNFSNLGFIISVIGFFFINKYININYLIVFTIITNILSLLFCFFIPKEKFIENEDSINKNYILKLLNKKTFEFVILNSILSLSMILINFFYVVIVEKIGFKSEDVMFIIIGYTLFELLCPKIIDIFGEENLRKNIFLFSIISAILFFIIPYINSYFVLIPMLILPVMISVLSFYIDKSENLYVDTISTERRATILSLFSMGANGMDVCFLFISVIFFSIALYFIFQKSKKFC